MRLASTARLLLGASQVARPEFLARDGAGDELTLRAIRVLGARDLAQGVITLIRPSRRVIRVGAAVDTIHALSMVGLAVVDRPSARHSARERSERGRLRPGRLEGRLAPGDGSVTVRQRETSDVVRRRGS